MRLWVEILLHRFFHCWKRVSLLVRLWVEIPPLSLIRNGMTSASLWGCELKYRYTISPECVIPRQPPCEAVSWNVSKEEYDEDVQVSASLWGCELKYYTVDNLWRIQGQPPCEAVSWNYSVHWDIMDGKQSASLWGCELKWKLLTDAVRSVPSASLWGCELKFQEPWQGDSVLSQPPCEAVSWNENF